MSKLTSYKQLELALGEQLRMIHHALSELKREEEGAQCKELLEKLAEDRFTLAVVGQFKRGKSSLMNAIIGQELLPTGVLPLTSVITKLAYGPVETLSVNHRNSIIPEMISVSELADYVTEKGNPGNIKKVVDVTIELPIPFLQKGLEFVDTPGVGSAVKENTETTYRFLPDCDAVLFVTGADTPMTNIEMNFLADLSEYVNKIFFVINKIDYVREQEKKELIEFVTEVIRKQTGLGEVKIFPLSSNEGLMATQTSDENLYGRSGIKALENTLISFLAKEKTQVFLESVAGKSLNILNELEVKGVFKEEYLEKIRKANEGERSVKFHEDPLSEVAVLKNAWNRITKIFNNRNKVKGMGYLPSGTEGRENPNQHQNKTVWIKNKTKELTMEAVEKSLEGKICPLCRKLSEISFDFYADWQYKLVQDELIRKEFAQSKGFCPLHTWQLLKVSSPYGSSIGFAPLAEEVASHIRNNIHSDISQVIDPLLQDTRHCLVCELLRQSEEKYISLLVALLKRDDGKKLYQQSEGLCLRHLKMLLKVISKSETREYLLMHAAQHFEQDTEDMRSYVLKRDGNRRGLLNQNEKDAYFRAINRIVGAETLFTP